MLDSSSGGGLTRYAALAISALAWGVQAAGSGLHIPGVHICLAPGAGGAPLAATLPLLLALNPPPALAVGWALMLAAMMPPLLIPDIHHIRFTSLARRRARSTTLFVAGYGGVWMLCGGLLTAAGIAAEALAPGSYLPALAAGLVALVWQASPLKQRCLNKCHETRPLRIFGLEADLDAARFGVSRGFWCVGACGWLMLVPMLLPQGHLIAMAAVALLVFCERLEEPKPPRWALRVPGQAARMIAARARIRWRRRASVRT